MHTGRFYELFKSVSRCYKFEISKISVLFHRKSLEYLSNLERSECLNTEEYEICFYFQTRDLDELN